jgi:cytochrome oxidase Cu insertion factor (SCO1/SenC/PrrC family)
MKLTKRVALCFFGLFLILLAGDFPLWGEEDHLAKFGVNKLDEKIDAPEFTLPDLNGKKRSLSDFQGKFIMLNFWATW